MTSLLNVLLADQVKALLEAPEMSGYADEERAMSKDTAMLIIHGALWCYSARSGSFGSCYAFDSLVAALEPCRKTIEGLWRLQDRLKAKQSPETQPGEPK